MKPVKQTTFGEGKGNCLQACLASILEIELDDIPWFGMRSDWFDKMNAWLAHFGLVAIDVVADSMPTKGRQRLGYHIVAGPSPRGDFWHAVVGYADRIVHDPHPSNDGLERVGSLTLFVDKLEKEMA